MAIAFVLGVVLLALLLFALPRVPLQLTSLVVVALLVVGRALEPREALAFFVDPTVLFLFALLGMTQGLVASGVVEPMGRAVAQLGKLGERPFVAAVMALVAVFSSCVSNTVTTAAFLPVVQAAARRTGVSPAKVLLPLAFASMLGGTIFLYGTTTNMVVSAAMAHAGMRPLAVAELTPLSVPLCVTGVLLVVLLAPRLLPVRLPPEHVLPERPRPPVVRLAHHPRVVWRMIARLEHHQPLPAGAAAMVRVRSTPQRLAPWVVRTERIAAGRARGLQPPYAVATVAIFVGSLLLGSIGVLPLPIAGFLGLGAMLATGCVDVPRLLRIDWRVLVLVAAMLALGRAVEKSGAGELLAHQVLRLEPILGARGILCVLMLVTIALSAPMSNQAAALVVLPVALSAAHGLGVDPRPFAVGIALSASLSFVTPLEPSCVLVYGVGGYRFSDFVRLGLPVTIVLVLLLTWGVPHLWPLVHH